jgi:hypothetical protein
MSCGLRSEFPLQPFPLDLNLAARADDRDSRSRNSVTGGVHVWVYRRAMSQRPTIIRVTADDLMSLVPEHGSTPLQVGAVLLLDARDGFNPAQALDHLA